MAGVVVSAPSSTEGIVLSPAAGPTVSVFRSSPTFSPSIRPTELVFKFLPDNATGNTTEEQPTTLDDDCPSGSIEHPQTSRLNLVFAMSVLTFCSIYIGISFILYINRRRQSPYLQRRNLTLMTFSAVGVVFPMSLVVRELVGRDVFPCIFLDIIPILYVVLLVNTLMVRLILYYGKVNLEKTMAINLYELSTRGSIQLRELVHKDSVHSIRRASTFRNANITEIDNRRTSETSLFGKKSRIYWASVLASNNFGRVLWTVQATVCFAVFGFLLMRNNITCNGCFIEFRTFIAAGAMAGLAFLIFFSFYLFSFRQETIPDPWGIKSETSQSVTVAVFSLFLWAILDSTDPGDISKDGVFCWNYILLLGYLAAFSISVPRQVWLSYFPPGKTSEKDDRLLKKILGGNDPVQLNYFKSFLIAELTIENYFFWRDANEWKRRYNEMGAKERYDSFRYIFDTYIDQNSILWINISSDQYQEVKRQDNELHLDIPDTILDNCMNTVFSYLLFQSLPKFHGTFEKAIDDSSSDDTHSTGHLSVTSVGNADLQHYTLEQKLEDPNEHYLRSNVPLFSESL